MKRPVSPAYSTDSLLAIRMCENEYSPRIKLQSKQEKTLPTLCEVCNIQLNSAVQAQIHYNGKSHQKRLKQVHKGRNANFQADPDLKRCNELLVSKLTSQVTRRLILPQFLNNCY